MVDVRLSRSGVMVKIWFVSCVESVDLAKQWQRVHVPEQWLWLRNAWWCVKVSLLQVDGCAKKACAGICVLVSVNGARRWCFRCGVEHCNGDDNGRSVMLMRATMAETCSWCAKVLCPLEVSSKTAADSWWFDGCGLNTAWRKPWHQRKKHEAPLFYSLLLFIDYSSASFSFSSSSFFFFLLLCWVGFWIKLSWFESCTRSLWCLGLKPLNLSLTFDEFVDDCCLCYQCEWRSEWGCYFFSFKNYCFNGRRERWGEEALGIHDSIKEKKL